jgi:hypothetical protein
MSGPSPLRWRSVPSSAIALHEWDGETVIRNERSGSSHLLGPLAGCVLQVLLKARIALGPAEIAAALHPHPAATDDLAEIETVLSEFRRLGLAEPESQ